MSDWAPKRFWKETRADRCDGGFTVYLDHRTVRTPAKAPFTLPTLALAEACAAEWEAQGEHIDPSVMPMTRTANSALDKVAVQHAEVADLIAAYGDSDLTCYRADTPVELVARQAEGWDPLLDWAHARFDARLEPRIGIMHAPQDQAALERLRAQVFALDAFRLAAFHDLVAISGSLIIGLAVAHDELDPEQAFNVSRIDEDWQAELWGADEEATEHAALKRQAFLDSALFFRLADQKT
ncbi:ATP12 family protein [Maritimibacter sp. UBA3975]|uniref:ATP12 family chaperone protein n=1 Tax=Maritimibacter sp. UBA3975 TaxID=1946833 RepID=UPI000C091F41|nr:ATP12 family protein [Maritimibacter sp. UBA3975]MAM63820.1 ATPase [Maritimibacter sp.]|tara:strand:- start:116933 stop:117649 length:717 start_codon:yes stop_codon:yes gene_type:complete